MKKLSKITVNWTNPAPGLEVKGFNVAVTKQGETPSNSSFCYGRAAHNVNSYVFNNVLVDVTPLDEVPYVPVTYVGWVQAVYTGGDSSWKSTTGVIIADDGVSSLATISDITSAQVVNITGGQVFKFPSGSTSPTPSQIVLTATLSSGLSGYDWEYFNGTSWVNLSGTQNAQTYTLDYANAAFSSGNPLRIRCVSGGVFDETTVVKIYDGEAITPILTNSTHSIPADSSGNNPVLTGSGTDIKVWLGTNALTYGTGNSQFSVSASGTAGLTLGGASTPDSYTRRFADLLGMSVDTGTVTYTITVKNAFGVSTVLTLKQTLTKVRAGVAGDPGANGWRTATLELYMWSASAPTGFPSGNSTYTWATGSFGLPTTPNGWSLLPPAAVAGQTLWGCCQTISNQETGAQNTVSWTTTTAYPVGGGAGINARSVSLAAPVLAFTYNTAGTTPSPANTTVTATRVNGEGTAYYRFSKNGVAGSWATTSTYTYTPQTTHSNMPDKITVEYSESSGGSPVLATDEIVMIGLRAGQHGISWSFPNSAHTCPSETDGSGAVMAGSGTTIQIYEGSSQLTFHTTIGVGKFIIGTPVVTPSGKITVGGAVGITGSGTTTATVADHTNFATDTDVVKISYPITARRSDGSDVSFSLDQTITKSKKGVVGPVGPDGKGAITILMPNASHTLPSTPNGFVTSYLGSGTTVQVYEGTSALSAVSSITANSQFTIGSPTIDPPGTITVGSRSYLSTTATVAEHSAMGDSTDTLKITYPISVRRADGTTTTMNMDQTLTKSKSGKAIQLYATRQGFYFSNSVLNPTTQTDITLTVSKFNITDTASISAINELGTSITLGGSGETRTLSSAQFSTSKEVIVTATVTSGSVTYTDKLVVSRLDFSGVCLNYVNPQYAAFTNKVDPPVAVSGACTASFDAANTYFRGKALKIISSGSTGLVVLAKSTADTDRNITVDRTATKWILSFYVKGDASTFSGTIRLYQSYGSTAHAWSVSSGGTAFQRVSIKFGSGSSAGFFDFSDTIALAIYGVTSGRTVYFDGFQLEPDLNGVASPFTEPPNFLADHDWNVGGNGTDATQINGLKLKAGTVSNVVNANTGTYTVTATITLTETRPVVIIGTIAIANTSWVRLSTRPSGGSWTERAVYGPTAGNVCTAQYMISLGSGTHEIKYASDDTGNNTASITVFILQAQ